MTDKGVMVDESGASVAAHVGHRGDVGIVGHWIFEAHRPGDGNRLLWREETKNRVVNQGLDGSLGSTLGAWTQVTSWFMGVTSGHPTIAAADTGSSHAGWEEFADYAATERPGYLPGAVSGQSITNASSKASISLNDAGSIGGSFLISVNSKGVNGGSLFAVSSFNLRALSSGDTLEVQATFTAAAG